MKKIGWNVVHSSIDHFTNEGTLTYIFDLIHQNI